MTIEQGALSQVYCKGKEERQFLPSEKERKGTGTNNVGSRSALVKGWRPDGGVRRERNGGEGRDGGGEEEGAGDHGDGLTREGT
jgi:hypothetical protein